MKKMKAKFKKIWLKALRSGKYQQGTGTLKKVERGRTMYCCLGVLQESIGCRIPMARIPQTLSMRATLSTYMLKKTGLDQNAQTILIDMNDTLAGDAFAVNSNPSISKYSFKKIANWIEKNL